MKFKIEDGGGRRIFKRGTYEDDNSVFIKKNLRIKPNDVFLDVGANIGWYSLLIDKCFPEVTSYAFEPDPVNIECFEYNLHANDAQSINLIPKAVAEKSGSRTMYIYKNSNKGRNSLLPIHDYGTLTIEVVRLDDFVKQNNITQPRFVKIDIEGYEYYALLGAKQVLQKVDLLLMEFAPVYMKRGNVEPRDLFNFIDELQFSPFLLQDNQLVPVTYKQLLKSDHNIDLYLLKENQMLIDSSLINI